MAEFVEMHVQNPELFWFASREEAAWLLDPADGRYDGMAPLRWPVIVPLLQASTHALRAGDWSTGPDGATRLPAVNVEELTIEERCVLALFFDNPVEADPWDRELIDGRHRTWGAWSAAPSLILPLRSRLLSDAALVNDPDYVRRDERDEWSARFEVEARIGLAAMRATVESRSPRYLAALRALADLPHEEPAELLGRG